jgi:hypothetical protein
VLLYFRRSELQLRHKVAGGPDHEPLIFQSLPSIERANSFCMTNQKMRRVPQVRGLSLGLEVAVPPTIDVIVRTKALSPLVRITIRYNYFLDFFPVSYILALFLKEVGGRNRKVPPCPHNSLAKLFLPSFLIFTSLLRYLLTSFFSKISRNHDARKGQHIDQRRMPSFHFKLNQHKGPATPLIRPCAIFIF